MPHVNNVNYLTFVSTHHRKKMESKINKKQQQQQQIVLNERMEHSQ